MSTTTKRRAKGIEREEAVLRAATQAIAELGLANVRVADIAQRAGMGPGHVTYYFPSKSELLMRAIRWSEEGLHAQIGRQVDRIADPWKRLQKLLDLAMAKDLGDPGWVLWLEVWSEAGTDPEVAAGSDEFNAWWKNALGEVIRYGCAVGSFATDEVDEIVVVLSALIDGLSIQLTLGVGELIRRDALAMCMSAAHRYLDPV